MLDQAFKYQEGSDTLELWVVTEEEKVKKPAILVYPTWHGRDEFCIAKARELAKLGYVGIAIDIYGKAKLGSSDKENATLMAPFVNDRKRLQKRIVSGFEFVQRLPFVNGQIGAIGFCFGGMCCLDLARSGTEVKAVVSFHGLLDPFPEAIVLPLKSQVLVLTGFDDPWVVPDTVLAFEKEMTDRKADWSLMSFGHTRHGFTNPSNTDDNGPNLYNSKIAKRSWEIMKLFFSEVF